MMRTGKLFLSAALSVLAFFGLSGCAGAAVSGPPASGGTVTDKTDHSAPKQIESKELTSFHAHFYLPREWAPGKGFYTFDVKTDDHGVLMASVRPDSTVEARISRPADEKLMAALQAIIDGQSLAAKNGRYRVTAGLPPQFRACRFEAGYATGEKITFTENNNPNAAWAKETYRAFADWFAEQGDESLLPLASKDVRK
ncbi:MAG: hypothetical protein IJ631_02965 [Schwartzia sp.]|nr:hypothetical protein [Schwartzia sp. (in: firmicutes)]